MRDDVIVCHRLLCTVHAQIVCRSPEMAVPVSSADQGSTSDRNRREAESIIDSDGAVFHDKVHCGRQQRPVERSWRDSTKNDWTARRGESTH